MTRAMASQITCLTILYSTVYSGADQRKHQSSALLAFVRGIHRWPVNSPHKGPVTRKMFPFDDVIILVWIDNTAVSSLRLNFSTCFCMQQCYRDGSSISGRLEKHFTHYRKSRWSLSLCERNLKRSIDSRHISWRFRFLGMHVLEPHLISLLELFGICSKLCIFYVGNVKTRKTPLALVYSPNRTLLLFTSSTPSFIRHRYQLLTGTQDLLIRHWNSSTVN